ncbi:unnamed protein product [Moneuplotes crassus]|uniref:Uncharacterized protein n=1 Tax=Euplotes crassus TaxID=5936 RepID=A0AAD1UNP9_EUPCR|nr:unnamed protein product [Moneuplotes crassus]
MRGTAESKLFEKMLQESNSPEHLRSHYKRYMNAQKRVKEFEKPLFDNIFAQEKKPTQSHMNCVNIVNNEIDFHKKFTKSKINGMRKSVLSIRGTEIMPKADRAMRKSGYNEIVRPRNMGLGTHDQSRAIPEIQTKTPIPLMCDNEKSDSEISGYKPDNKFEKIAKPPVRLK